MAYVRRCQILGPGFFLWQVLLVSGTVVWDPCWGCHAVRNPKLTIGRCEWDGGGGNPAIIPFSSPSCPPSWGWLWAEMNFPATIPSRSLTLRIMNYNNSLWLGHGLLSSWRQSEHWYITVDYFVLCLYVITIHTFILLSGFSSHSWGKELLFMTSFLTLLSN